MTIKGIDVSSFQEDVNWELVKEAGYEFAIIKAGFGQYTSQKDPEFEAHFKGAKAAGLKVGIYWYTYADSAERAKREAKACLTVMGGRDIDLPIYFDVEHEPDVMKVSNATRTAMVNAFCETIEAAGYKAGVYADLGMLEDKLNMGKIKYPVWCAQYHTECQYPGWTMWQYSMTGKVPGVDGNCDVDVMQMPEPVALCSLVAPVLKNGMRGTSVMILQSVLNCYGAALREDGVWGKLTDAAVREYQRKHNLYVDGIVGKKTWTSLMGGG